MALAFRQRHAALVGAALVSLLSIPGCGDGGGRADAMVDIDSDEDGYGETLDCDDSDRFVYPGAVEVCDGIDNDCDATTDEGYDGDGDRFTVCAGDCRDGDAGSYPGAPEIPDGVDNDCDGIVDDNTSRYDDDGDGYSEDQGDCNDDPLAFGESIGPGAVEVQLGPGGAPEGLDNDCDGVIDEALEPCGVGGDRELPDSYADAFDACNFVTLARWRSDYPIDPRSRAILSEFGSYTPRGGDDLFVLSTGIAADADQPEFVSPEVGTAFEYSAPHPAPVGPIGCSSGDPPAVNDYTEVELHLQVPSNADAFSFDFNFMSVEFPEFVCRSFDDTFLAMLESAAFTGNISFDAMGNRVSINVGFFDVCDKDMHPVCTGAEPLFGSGYEFDGGGTGWLTTTAPVIPGEKITLRFILFDEGDWIYDSAVLLDNFRWHVDEVICPDGAPPPCTIDAHQPGAPPSRFVRRR